LNTWRNHFDFTPLTLARGILSEIAWFQQPSSAPTQCNIAKNSHIAIVNKELIATPRDNKIFRGLPIAHRMAKTEQGTPIAQNLNE